MRVVYDGPYRAVNVAAVGLIALRGEPIEVPDVVGLSLIEQDTWSDPDAPPDTATMADPAVPAGTDVPDYRSWSAARLREALAGRRLPTDGTRPVLAERLADHVRTTAGRDERTGDDETTAEVTP
ncbi:SAP domain-containing protein [Saccharothrix texasensis]|uniref:SAP domain-containing protein n=1 Tax=Saccharothrix texasensis TaxID=103734 RepID=A0A3N1H1K6_9PSEU|nr:SAP domain-containing protein [Saccharothrix texasensis]ROP36286.1 SAP domain-containing protein [Saccharothrix texasensis]